MNVKELAAGLRENDFDPSLPQYKDSDVRGYEVDKRLITFVASTEQVDRAGDIIRVDGWDTRNYMRNPVFLLAHKSSEMPIGRTKRIWVDGKKLMATVEFLPEGIDQRADLAYQLFKQKFLNAVSVGFKSIEHEWRKDPEGNYIGIDFKRTELLEISAVSVPANAAALAVSRDLKFPTKIVEEVLVDLPKNLGASARNGLRKREVELLALGVSSAT